MSQYKAVFFDLDGTLVPMDTEEFLQRYFAVLAKFFAKKGFDNAEDLVKLVFAGTKAMCAPHLGQSNMDAFWRFFCEKAQVERSAFLPLMDEFYTTDFNEIGKSITPDPHMRSAIELLKEKKYPLYLTTMPLFPLVAVKSRLSWIQLSPDMFERITTYENSDSIKPMAEYYQANVDFAGVPAQQVLMVGNHTREDLAACKIGCDAFIVTDHLLNPDNVDLSTVKHGSMEEFKRFVSELPVCE